MAGWGHKTLPFRRLRGLIGVGGSQLPQTTASVAESMPCHFFDAERPRDGSM
jgi:hypothetical protein